MRSLSLEQQITALERLLFEDERLGYVLTPTERRRLADLLDGLQVAVSDRREQSRDENGEVYGD